jgi:hypothetical protein
MSLRPEEAARLSFIETGFVSRPWGLRSWLAACGLLAAALIGFPHAAAAGPDPYAPKWNPWVEFGGLGADDDNSRGIVELWSPLLQGPTALFFFEALPVHRGRRAGGQRPSSACAR